ncbi:MAG: hypothetical protein IT479_04010 [Xanthomonadales bacterium]|nr:hypothetical protein [Xanthomonadales bacterium]
MHAPQPPTPGPALAFLLILLFSLLPTLALAQRIQVEVIVFAYANPDAGAALAPEDPDPTFEGMLLGAEGNAYLLQPTSALRLNGAADALARHARTRTLAHFGWQQDQGGERAIRLRGRASVRSGNATSSAEHPELDGDLRLRFGRGIEVHVDALLRVAETDRAGRPAGVQRFRLNSRRVLGRGELHYLDHPALGVLVRIDPVDAAAP